jgi:hypothetical protein
MGKQNRFSGTSYYTCGWIEEVFGTLAKTLPAVTTVAYSIQPATQNMGR